MSQLWRTGWWVVRQSLGHQNFQRRFLRAAGIRIFGFKSSAETPKP